MSYTDQDFEKTAASHTSGPWAVLPDRPYEVLDRTASRIAIASAGEMPAGRADNVVEANARLIAAAPDLLAALNALAAWADHMGGWDSPAWEQAEESIAKATGREP